MIKFRTARCYLTEKMCIIGYLLQMNFKKSFGFFFPSNDKVQFQDFVIRQKNLPTLDENTSF